MNLPLSSISSLLEQRGLRVAVLRMPERCECSLWNKFGFLQLFSEEDPDARSVQTVAFDDRGECYTSPGRIDLSDVPRMQRFTPEEHGFATRRLLSFPHYKLDLG